MRRLGWIGFVALLGTFAAGAASADWPCARHDPQRTASVPGASNILTPGLAWRYYLGGSLGDSQYIAADINGDGKLEVVYASGGKVIAKRPDDTILWETPPLSLGTIVDLWDVDGDGKLDVVASGSPASVAILSAVDGSVEWQLPANQIGTLGAVRTADLNGDGKRDLYVSDDHCATIVGTDAAVAYSFASGFKSATPLWTISAGGAGGCHSSADTITDVNGDGVPDVVMAASDSIEVFSGATGKQEFTSSFGADGYLWGSADFDAAPVLPGGAHLLVYYENNYETSAGGGHRVMAYRYDSSSAALVKAWERDAGTAPANDRIAYDARSLGSYSSSLSGEQVAFSTFDSSASAWTLYVVDAASGSVLAMQPGLQMAGAADVDGDGVLEILAAAGSGPAGVYKLVSSGGGVALVAKAVAPASTTVAHHIDRAMAAWKNLASPVATVDVDRDKIPEVVLVDGSSPPALEAVDLSGSGTGSAKATYTAPTGTTILTTEVFTDPTSMLLEPVIALSSGYVVLLDPTTFMPLNVGSGEFALNGMRVGGYYSGVHDIGPTPVVGTLVAGGAPSVVVRDSRGYLLRLDPGATASVAAPPSPVWAIPGATFPSLVDVDGDKLPEVVANVGGTVTAYKADGRTVVWSAAVGANSYDLPFGDANADGTADIFYSYTGSSVLYIDVLDGKTGMPLWASPYTYPYGWGTLPMAVGDMNGDGHADAVSATNYLSYLSGVDGGPIAKSAVFNPYGEPLVADVLGKGLPQAYVHGGYYAPQLHDSSAAQTWSVTSSDHFTWDYAALIYCGTQKLFVEGEYLSPILHAYDAATGAEVWNETLASGAVFPSGTTPPASAIEGFLGNVTVKQDLTGKGHPSALVGSTDGYLYAVQPCASGGLDWTYDFGYAVGEPVVADSTGAGLDQVLVSVADGYLYALNEQAIAPPAHVYATDPPEGHPHDPVATIRTVSTLYAEWPQVAGATQYQWALYTSGGTLVGTTGYTTMAAPSGSLVDVQANGLPLVDGGRYYFAVRAVGPAGSSSDALSNIVQVSLGLPVSADGGPSSPDGGRAGADAGSGQNMGQAPGCGCDLGGRAPAAPLSGLAFFALLGGLLALGGVQRVWKRRR